MLNFDECGFGLQLYSNVHTRETYLESWNASTKHPDCMYKFSDYDKSPCMTDLENIVGWMCEIASKTVFPWSLFEYTDFIRVLAQVAFSVK